MTSPGIISTFDQVPAAIFQQASVYQAAIKRCDTVAKWLDAALRTAGALRDGESL